ncbi:MAG: hypothetical protein R2710_06390 [Acidimicrobiales bacterium]
MSEAIERTFKPLQQFTRGWMMAPATADYGVAVGMRSGNDFWIVGRAGVMGDCTAETATAVLGFKEPSSVAAAWAAIPEHLSPSMVAAEYAGRVLAWGDAELARFDPERMERLHLLGRRIIDAAPASLGAIFEGWRRMPQGETYGQRVAMTTQTLREMRGAAHLVAILSVGLTPLGTILASTNARLVPGRGTPSRWGSWARSVIRLRCESSGSRPR